MLPVLCLASSAPVIEIAPGVKLPYVSLGLGSGQKGNVTQAVPDWISVGGKSFDTALIYGDQEALVKGLHAAHVAQKDVFIISKVPCGSYEQVQDGIKRTLTQLQTDVVDLMLMHAFPNPTEACNVPGASAAETWRALEDMHMAGSARAIGVSSFGKQDLSNLSKMWRQKPHLNQASLAVGHHEDDAIEYCRVNGIAYMAYSPLCGGGGGSTCTRGSVLKMPEVQSVAKAHGVAVAQVALKWIVQQGFPLATATWNKEYMKEDLDLWSWGNLTAEEMEQLSAVPPALGPEVVLI